MFLLQTPPFLLTQKLGYHYDHSDLPTPEIAAMMDSPFEIAYEWTAFTSFSSILWQQRGPNTAL